MKLSKLLLTSTTAFGLSMTAAFADGNEALIEQDGNYHNLSIDQNDGENNKAGASGNEILQKSQFTQNGNTLSLIQRGDRNEVGLGVIVNRGSGFFQLNQSGPGSSATVVQDSDDNKIVTINQVARTARATGNTLTATQDTGDGNEITAISQDANGSTDGTTAGRLGHSADLTQSGTNNLIASVKQIGADNSTVAQISGESNGRGALSGFAAASGATTSTLEQNGSSNDIDLVINGRPSIPVADENQFGITQLGAENTVNTVTLDSKRANLGIYQDGDRNEVAMSTIEGNDNTIGIRQLQDDNLAQVNITGNGVGNSFFIDQDGMFNEGYVTISGSNNGDGLVSNDPLAGAVLTDTAGVVDWERGVLRQRGDFNTADLSQYGSGNMFGTLQIGDNNSIAGVQDGSTNQVAVLQLGNGNTADYNQSGTGNNAAITQ